MANRVFISASAMEVFREETAPVFEVRDEDALRAIAELQPEDEDGRELRHGREPEHERIVRQRQNEPALSDLLHPRPDEADELAEPEQPEVAVPERAPALRDGCGGHAGSLG